MSKDTGQKRVAIMVGAGYIPGINAVVAGASLAAGKLGWELVGIRDGFEGILHPEKYPDSGLFDIDPRVLNLDPNTSSVLGQSARIDPFNVRTINDLEMVEEVDMSDELLKNKSCKDRCSDFNCWRKGTDHSLPTTQKGLNTICVPVPSKTKLLPLRCHSGLIPH